MARLESPTYSIAVNLPQKSLGLIGIEPSMYYQFPEVTSYEDENFIPQIYLYIGRHAESIQNLLQKNPTMQLSDDYLVTDKNILLSRTGYIQAEVAAEYVVNTMPELLTAPADNIIFITSEMIRTKLTAEAKINLLNEARKKINPQAEELEIRKKSPLINELELGIAHSPYWIKEPRLKRYFDKFKERRQTISSLLRTPVVDPRDVTSEDKELAKKIFGLESDSEIYGQTLIEKESQLVQFVNELNNYLQEVAKGTKKGEKIYVFIETHGITMSILHLVLTGQGKRLTDLTPLELDALINVKKEDMALLHCSSRKYKKNLLTNKTIFERHTLNDTEQVEKKIRSRH